ncbi:hypothetical protein LSAT2_026322 [Lamellibrachia satsuma]|nr:hypothetical protein LSAT2_026322 [Lamellibrachia satsuma]
MPIRRPYFRVLEDNVLTKDQLGAMLQHVQGRDSSRCHQDDCLGRRRHGHDIERALCVVCFFYVRAIDDIVSLGGAGSSRFCPGSLESNNFAASQKSDNGYGGYGIDDSTASTPRFFDSEFTYMQRRVLAL